MESTEEAQKTYYELTKLEDDAAAWLESVRLNRQDFLDEHEGQKFTMHDPDAPSSVPKNFKPSNYVPYEDSRPVLTLGQYESGRVKFIFDGKELTHILADPAPELLVRGNTARLTLTLDCRLELPPDNDT